MYYKGKRRRTAKGKPKRRVARRTAGGKKKVYRKTFRSSFNRPSTRSIPGNGIGFPERMRVKLHYDAEYGLTSALGVCVNQIMRGNGGYDPDVTGAGGQPMWWDTYQPIYETYRIFGSSCTITAIPASGVANSPFFADWTIIPSKSVTAFSGAVQDLVTEQPYAKTMTIGDKPKTMKHYMGAAKLWGEPRKRILNDPAFEALTLSANPANQFYWHIVMNASDRTTNITQVVRVRITYYVEFSGRLRPVLS